MKKGKKCKWLALALAAMMLLAAGCGPQGGEKVESNIPTGEISYPLETDETITYWVRLAGALGTSVTNFGDTPFAKAWEEAVGVDIEFIHPAQGQEAEKLNLLIAGNDLPDIIESDWLSRDPEGSISKNTILKLNDLIANHAPNLTKFLAENPDIDRAVKTDEGSYYVFPFVRNGEKLLATSGFMLRGDWLEELGLAVPETMDEWEAVLTAFKGIEGVTAPFIGSTGDLYRFMCAYGLLDGLYIEDGVVKHGRYDEKALDFLTTMKRWYDNGLIDPNFALLDGDQRTAAIVGGTAGATNGAGGGGMGVWLNAAKANGDEKYTLVAAKYPSLNKGEVAMFGSKQWPYSPLNGGAITGQAKHPELAARVLDYAYSEAGHMLNNFGIEGTSYNMVDGEPIYADVITANPDGLSIGQALPLYVRAANEAPIIQDQRYIEQYYALPEQKDALNQWSANDHEKYAMPQVTLTADEAKEYSKIMNDVNTYMNESFMGFIIGSKPLSEFDAYMAKLKEMEIDRALEIYAGAYERFQNRK